MRVSKKTNNNLIKNSVILGLLIALICGAVTTIVIGFNLKFLISLLAGISLGSVNTIISDYFNKRAIEKGKAMTVVISGQLRLIIFAVLFYFAITKLGYAGALGAGSGFLASYVGIMVATALRPKHNPVYAKNNKVEHENGLPKTVLIKDFEMVKYSKGRTFITHRLFNKREDIQNA